MQTMLTPGHRVSFIAWACPVQCSHDVACFHVRTQGNIPMLCCRHLTCPAVCTGPPLWARGHTPRTGRATQHPRGRTSGGRSMLCCSQASLASPSLEPTSAVSRALLRLFGAKQAHLTALMQSHTQYKLMWGGHDPPCAYWSLQILQHVTNHHTLLQRLCDGVGKSCSILEGLAAKRKPQMCCRYVYHALSIAVSDAASRRCIKLSCCHAGFQNIATAELCARWIAVGAWQPFTRDHHAQSFQELYRSAHLLGAAAHKGIKMIAEANKDSYVGAPLLK